MRTTFHMNHLSHENPIADLEKQSCSIFDMLSNSASYQISHATSEAHLPLRIHLGDSNESEIDPNWFSRKKYGDNVVSDTYDGMEGMEGGEEVCLTTTGKRGY
ncbi:unnamed protein product [Cuscuta europaea]|uniref:Uncharacterized protein n=1 Tax=Cuscuta europaea TaxID=41803 RepID=A0A9P0ZZG4_CUSEU|nr:unnamed protein product [Cuscuta europaea]